MKIKWWYIKKLTEVTQKQSTIAKQTQSLKDKHFIWLQHTLINFYFLEYLHFLDCLVIFFFITQHLEETQAGRKTLLKDKVKLWRALKWPGWREDEEAAAIRVVTVPIPTPCQAASLILGFWVMGRAKGIHLLDITLSLMRLWVFQNNTLPEWPCWSDMETLSLVLSLTQAITYGHSLGTFWSPILTHSPIIVLCLLLHDPFLRQGFLP